MTPGILKKIHSMLNHNNLLHAVFWGVCILAFLLLFRKSNLIPTLANGFNGRKQLRHTDCLLDYQQRKVVVGIRWAKNHQFSRELLTFLLPELPNSVLCPFVAVENIRRLVPWTEQQHLFQLTDGNSLTYRRFQGMLRAFLKKVKVDYPGEYSSHSFRRGGTTFCFLCGVPLPLIKVLGNWKSEAYLLYIEFPLETRTVACELVKKRLLVLNN